MTGKRCLAPYAIRPFACACLALYACAPSETARRPRNAILITLDTTRADALSCYGGRPGLTPHLDRLARESLRFERAYTVAPLTLPAHASMLTGLVPPRHTVRDNGLAPLPRPATTLAELARARGFQTAAFVAATALDRAFALDQGFDLYVEPRTQAQASTTPVYLESAAPEIVRAAQGWLAQRDERRPFLLWAHFFEPHAPCTPPADALRRAGGDPYLGEVVALDDAVGELLEGLRSDGLLDQSIVLVLADHGEGRGDHGEPTHGSLCYESTLRIPFLLRHPDGRRAGEVSSATVSAVDVFPTLVEALGLGGAGDCDGVSLYESEPAPGRGVYFESYAGYLNFGWSPLAGWSDGELKVLFSSETELYELAADPGELRDLAPARAAALDRARSSVAALLERPALPSAPAGELSAELLRGLRMLGYGATGGVLEAFPHPLEPSPRPSPRSRAGELQPFEEANEHIAAGRFVQAIPLLRAITHENRDNTFALDLLTYALMQVDGYAEAVPLLERRLSLGAPRSDTLMSLGACLERAGDDERALAAYRQALEIDPGFEPALGSCVRLLERLGRAGDAAPYRRRLEAAGAR